MDEAWFDRLLNAIERDGRTAREISVAAGLGQNYVQQDGVFAFKPQGKQAAHHAQPMPDTRLIGALSNDDLRRLTTELAQLVEMLEALLTMLPEVPEVLGPR